MESAHNGVDVVICGGGLAGLCLARQLRLELPELSVAVVDRLSRPLPEATLKVGESTVELSTHYLNEILQLQAYFEQHHLPKLGLRFFFGDSHGPFEERPEFGTSLFPPVPSHQIDRGRLENDLRDIVAGMGVELFEGTLVEEIRLATGEESHEVICRRLADSHRFKLTGHWVVDALGRRRLLQSKLNLKLPSGHSASAAWWRINRRLDVEEMAAQPSRRWMRRNVEPRYLSTNHLMGRGYWVWLIPLSSGATSLGIVTDETIHPLATYGLSYGSALAWLEAHEPALARLLGDEEPMDFHSLKNYSYYSRQLYSQERWSCVGEAGLFLDPLYSPGSDFIALGNTVTAELIAREKQGVLKEADFDQFNRLMLEYLAPITMSFFKGTYPAFGHGHIFVAKFVWDTGLYWATVSQLFFQELVRRPTPELLALLRRYIELNERVQRFFGDWAGRVAPQAPLLPLGDLTRMPLMQLLHMDLVTHRTYDQFMDVARRNLDRFEELAQVIFWQAVAECLPQHLPEQPSRPPWINAWAICLSPERWEEEGLFSPASAPRPLRAMKDNLAGIFAPMSWWQRIRIELPYRLLHIGRGAVNYGLVRFIHRKFMQGKRALWPRRVFLADYPSRPAVIASNPVESAQAASH